MRTPFVVILGLLLMSGCTQKHDDAKSQILNQEQASALEAKILLTELRAGQITNAEELLEMKMDTAIIGINSCLTHVSASERSTAEATLRALKAYREEHPRRVEAVLPDTESVSVETAKMREKPQISFPLSNE